MKCTTELQLHWPVSGVSVRAGKLKKPWTVF